MSSVQQQLIVPESLANQRIDQVLPQLMPDYSRSRIQTWITQGHVIVDGKPVRNRDKAIAGQVIEINAPIEAAVTWEAQDIKLVIVYEDDDLLIINKPAGLVVHPGAGNSANTLVNALLHHEPALQQVPRAGIVHRLDKETSGLLVVAKTLAAHHYLVAQLQEHKVQRTYQCVVYGHLIAEHYQRTDWSPPATTH
jgi:Pseudouridylate synthases, 23S RNA-specific